MRGRSHLGLRYDWVMMAESTSAFLKALAETVCWCATQPTMSEATESQESVYRRGLIEEAGNILRRRPAYESDKWRRAMDMLKEAQPDSLAPLEHQLRSSVLRPLANIGATITEEEREAIVSGVVSERSRLLQIHESDYGKRWQDLGRLLIYVPSENVADGASKYASKGFFDAHDAPPWDSWVHYSQGELICWVPTALVSLAQVGIDANAFECIRWAETEPSINSLTS